jgi:UDP-N-acetylmuramate dehydrogenase
MAEVLRGELRQHEPMAGHVSWRAGGAVARAYFPADLDDLAAFLAGLRHDESLLMVGLGSNLLIRDGGFDGTAIFTHGVLDTLRREADGSFYAEAGVASPKLARFVGNQGCAEAEFLAGIPGTVGGALAMNAGCHGGETWRYVERVTASRSSARRKISPSAIATSGSKAPATKSSPRHGSAFRPGMPQRRAHVCANCWSDASRPSRWLCPTPVRCSGTRRATMPRA